MPGNALCNGSSSRCIMYQSRMCYLKSRESESRSQSRSGKRPNRGTVSRKQKPCSVERLLPPIELMTRERSFRYLSWKYNNNSGQIKKLDCLIKKKKHCDFEWPGPGHNRNEEIEKIKGEKENEVRSKQNDRIHLMEGNKDGNRPLPIIGEQKLKNNMIRSRKRGSFIESATVVKASAALLKNKRSSISKNEKIELNDNISFGESFSFLNDWRRESKRYDIVNLKKISK